MQPTHKHRTVTTPLFPAPSFQRFRRTTHGGLQDAGRRKLERPFTTRQALHVVLKSHRARGSWSLLKRTNRSRVSQVVYGSARRFGVRVLDFANAGTHVHLLVRAESRVAFQNFLRTVAALLARRITGARKGKPVGKFWDALAFSSLVKWGSQMAAVHRYFSRNRLEAIGFFTPDDRTLTYEVALGVATTRRRL